MSRKAVKHNKKTLKLCFLLLFLAACAAVAFIYYKSTFRYIKKSAEIGIPVISIVCDENDLYDYYTGIMVPGFDADNGGKGNYYLEGEEWIKPAKMLMVDSSIKPVINQKIGLKVYGGTSRYNPVKSLKVISEKKYYGNNGKTIDLNFYDRPSTLSNVLEYNSLHLRGGSQDQYHGANIKSAVMSKLAEESSFDGCTASERAAVYLNHSFYGIVDIQQNYSDNFLKKRFNLPDSEGIELFKGSEKSVFAQMGIDEVLQSDLSKPENREALESKLDVEDYLLYYAVNTLVNNTDWPFNNFQAWRYTGEEKDSEYADGRVRLLVNDTDCIYRFEGDARYGDGDLRDVFESVLADESGYFYNLISQDCYKNRFIIIVSDLLNSSFRLENVLEIIDEEYDRIKKANDSLVCFEDWHDPLASVERMKKAAEQNDSRYREDIEKYLRYSDAFSMELSADDGSAITWSTMRVENGDSYCGEYYCGSRIELQAEVYPGYEFKYWIVNGEKNDSRQLTVSGNQSGDVIKIELCVEKIQSGKLVINSLSAKSKREWIEIKNVGNEVVESLADWAVSDGDNLDKYQLPDACLRPGESYTLNRVSLSRGETVALSYKGKTVDAVTVPRMSCFECYSRNNDGDEWVFVPLTNHESKRFA